MIHEHKEELYIKPDRLSDLLFDERSIFFDIETTGFSPAHTQIYLIGCASRKDNTMLVDQFFATTKEEEVEILKAFMDLVKNFDTLISYNGIGFDIPFLKAKCDMYGIEECFSSLNYLDIFKSISSIKFLLKLPNYKQKTIESFLDIRREDPFSGGELINVYYGYQKNHDDETLHVLMLHNYEDVLGMADLLPALSYLEIFHGQYSITETNISKFHSHEGESQKELIITLNNDYPVPKRVSYFRHGFYFVAKDSTTTIRVPIFKGELHYFYPDYKNYYYLPDEDIAIHKSVASFVEKGYRETAHAFNCYNRKSGEFLPQYEEIMNPIFRENYKDKISYFELTEDFCSSDVMLRRYVDHILNLFMG